jgi:hypothetical protein
MNLKNKLKRVGLISYSFLSSQILINVNKSKKKYGR